MPKSFQFKAGSLIYFQGDNADKVFILQNGKVSLVYQDIETGEDVRDQVQPGEFFGVKSALGRYSREENAIALADSSVMALTLPEFEQLASSNTRIIMKMLKVFSNQMRRIHTQVSSIMEKEDVNPEEGLFGLGDYYFKNKRYSQAKYVFSRYLTYYPAGKKSAEAARNLDKAEIAIAQYGSKSPEKPAAPRRPPASAPQEKEFDAAGAYYDAVSLISQEKYKEAHQGFKKIIDINGDPEWTIKSSYEIGRCLFFLAKYNDCIKHYTAMLVQYPRHPDIRDAMFYIGQCHERTGNQGHAAAFYKKILAMPADAGDGTTTKTKRALEALEE